MFCRADINELLRRCTAPVEATRTVDHDLTQNKASSHHFCRPLLCSPECASRFLTAMESGARARVTPESDATPAPIRRIEGSRQESPQLVGH